MTSINTICLPMAVSLLTYITELHLLTGPVMQPSHSDFCHFFSKIRTKISFFNTEAIIFIETHLLTIPVSGLNPVNEYTVECIESYLHMMWLCWAEDRAAQGSKCLSPSGSNRERKSRRKQRRIVCVMKIIKILCSKMEFSPAWRAILPFCECFTSLLKNDVVTRSHPLAPHVTDENRPNHTVCTPHVWAINWKCAGRIRTHNRESSHTNTQRLTRMSQENDCSIPPARNWEFSIKSKT